MPLIRVAYALFLAPSIVIAQVAPRDAIGRLRQQYENMPALISRFHYTSPETKKQHMARYVIGADGRYSEMHWVEVLARPGTDWKKHPAHATAFDGTNLLATESGSTEYTVTPAGDMAKTPPGIMQWSAAPAPIIPILVEFLAASSDLIVEADPSGGAGVLVANSVSVGLAMTWDEQGRILSVRRGTAQGNSVEHRYSKFVSLIPGRPEVAQHRVERITVMKDGKPTLVRETPLDFIVTISQDPSADLTFDPGHYGMLRYDKETGDVTFPDGRILYNRNRLEAMMDEGSWWKTLRPWAMSVLGVGVFVGGVVTIRRMRRA